jgi:hypothetical protein
MGRKVTDGLSLDFSAPASTLIEEGEIYRVDGITHFAVTGGSLDGRWIVGTRVTCRKLCTAARCPSGSPHSR